MKNNKTVFNFTTLLNPNFFWFQKSFYNPDFRGYFGVSKQY